MRLKWETGERGPYVSCWQRPFRTSVVFICSRLAARLPAFSAMLMVFFFFTLHMIFNEILHCEHYFLILQFEHAATVTSIWLNLIAKPYISA